MKIIFYPLLILLLCLFGLNTSAQWIDTGKALHTDKNVGIGIENNNYSFYVRKNQEGWQGRFNNSNAAGAEVYLAHGAGYGMYIRGKTTDNKYTLLLRNGSNVSTNVFYNSGTVGLGLEGNVGIGTKSPTEKLQVEGYIMSHSYSPQVILRRNTSTGGYIQGISTQLEDGSPNWWFGTLHGTEWRVTKGDYNAAPLFRIKDNGDVYLPGKVGIGTTAAVHKLHVNGDFKSDAANVSSLNISGLGGSSATQMLTVSANGTVGKAAIPSGGSSVWNAGGSTVSTNVGSYGKVDFSDFSTDVALRLSRQDGSSTWWFSHRGPDGVEDDEMLEFIHQSPSLGYVTPLWLNREGANTFKLTSTNIDATFITTNNLNTNTLSTTSLNTDNITTPVLKLRENGADSNWDLIADDPNSAGLPILNLKLLSRNKSALKVLHNGSVDMEAVPGSGNGSKMTLDGNGSIIMETRNNQLLGIKGNTCIDGTLEIKGTGNCVPDYVFADDYELRSIEELAEFIKKESHLPGVKSEEAFMNSGFDVVADSYSFLEKIEELTLYTIAQEDKINQLSAKLEAQQKETAKLQAMLQQVLSK